MISKELMRDKLFIQNFLNETELLFYGEMEELFPPLLKKVLLLIKTGNTKDMFDTDASYWFIVSILNKNKYISYGTSPRYPFMTEKGEKLLSVINYMFDYKFMTNIDDNEEMAIYVQLRKEMSEDDIIEIFKKKELNSN